MLAIAAAPATVAPAVAAPPSPLDALVDAAAERLKIADPVAAFKWGTHGDIDDPAREQEVLDAVRNTATARGIDPVYVGTVFRDQIDATESIEYTRFAQWKLDPANRPTTAPDLSASRAQIDALNVRMVDEMAAQWNLLHSPACPIALRDAISNATAAHQLDNLYQPALAYATRSYCR